MSKAGGTDDTGALHQSVDKAMTQLASVWDEIGIAGEQRAARRGVVLLHVTNLLDEMIREERALRDRLLENVNKLGVELLQLCTELALPLYEPASSLSTLQLEKDLRACSETLTREKCDRLALLRQLTKHDLALCDDLAATPHPLTSLGGGGGGGGTSVPSRGELGELEAHIASLEAEQNKRRGQLAVTRAKIQKLLDALALSPNSEFERDVVSDADDAVKLSVENLRRAQHYHDELESLAAENTRVMSALWTRVESLWDRLEVPANERSHFRARHSGCSESCIHALREELVRCERLKLQHIHRFVDATRKQLSDWWDRCYVSGELNFKPFYEEEMTEELLEAHEGEIARWRDHYRQNQDLLERVAKRQKLWTEFLELEHRANNPDRFLNRGGNLLKEEKSRKKLTVELPKVDAEVSRYIAAAVKQTGRAFLIYGQTFDAFIRHQRDEYAAEKENEKLHRQQVKAKQMEEEILFGSKPATPNNKRFAPGGTPLKTPNKFRKMETPTKSVRGSRTNLAGGFTSPVCLPPRSKEKSGLNSATKNNVRGAVDSKGAYF